MSSNHNRAAKAGCEVEIFMAAEGFLKEDYTESLIPYKNDNIVQDEIRKTNEAENIGGK